MKKLLLLFFLFFILLVNSQTTYTFTTTGDWSNPANWDVYPGTTINNGDNVVIGGSKEVTIDVDIINNGTLTMNFGSGKIINNKTIINNNRIDNEGFISNRVGGVIINYLNIYNRHRIDSYGEIINNLYILNYTSSNLNNYGNLNNKHSLISYVSAIITNKTDGFMENNARIDGDGTIRNSGELINNANFYTINFYNYNCFINNGHFQLTGGTFLNNGWLKGTNTAHKSSFTNDRNMNPGHPIGTYTFDNNFTNASNAALNIELGGSGAAGVDYDQLSVIGDANLDGKITIRYLNNFEPNIGDSFTVLTAANINGTFPIIDFPTLVDKEWSVIYNSNSIVIEVTNPLSIENEENNSDLILYPNPASNILTIKSRSPITKIEIYDSTGSNVLSKLNKNKIDVSTLNTGIYFIKIEDINGVLETKKILKK